MLKKLLDKFRRPATLPSPVPDLAEITRNQLVSFSDPPDLNQLSEAQKDSFYTECKRLKENDTLDQLLDLAIEEIKANIWFTTNSEHIIYDRFTIKGIVRVRDLIDEYSAMGEDPDGTYDKHSIL